MRFKLLGKQTPQRFPALNEPLRGKSWSNCTRRKLQPNCGIDPRAAPVQGSQFAYGGAHMTLVPSSILPKNFKRADGSIQVSPRLTRIAAAEHADVFAELKTGETRSY